MTKSNENVKGTLYSQLLNMKKNLTTTESNEEFLNLILKDMIFKAKNN